MERTHDVRSDRAMDRIEDLEQRARDLESEIDHRERVAYESEHRARKDALLAAGREDIGLDEAVDGTFPASDPASPTAGAGGSGDASRARELSAELDEALDDTFPASDPPAIVAPRGDGDPG